MFYCYCIRISNENFINRDHVTGLDCLCMSPWQNTKDYLVPRLSEHTMKTLTTMLMALALTGCGTYGEPRFSPDGTKLVFSSLNNRKIELFDFDRCSSTISNPRMVDSSSNIFPYSAEFSPSQRYLYAVSDSLFIDANPHFGYLYQYDLESPNIPASRTLIWSDGKHRNMPGQLQLAPNGKIYMAYGSGANVKLSRFVGSFMRFYPFWFCIVRQHLLNGLASQYAQLPPRPRWGLYHERGYGYLLLQNRTATGRAYRLTNCAEYPIPVVSPHRP